MRDRGVFLVTTSNGMPIGEPSHSPEPKSAWRPVEAPIELTIAAEFAATGSLSTRWFHGFDFGKTGHLGAAGTRSAPADGAPSARATAIASRSRRRLMGLVSTAEARECTPRARRT